MLTPRPYQSAAVDKVRALIREGVRRIVVVAPTGSGKTVFAGMIIDGAMRKGSPMLFLAHRKELIDQPSRMLDAMGIDHGVIKGKHWRNRPDALVQVGSIQTLVRRTPPPAKIVFIDEGHRVLGSSYRKLLENYPDAVIIILTATPWRLDGKGLKDVAEAMVVMAEAQQLVDEGSLATLRVYAPETPDLTGLRRTRGDYDTDALYDRLRRDTARVGKIVEHWKNLGEDQPTLFFGTTVDDSKMVCAQFVEAGIPALHVDGETSDGAREAAIEKLSSGEIKVLCNCSLFSEGFDLPKLGCVILGRPTDSLTLFLQQAGRVMRPYEGKKYGVILDHAGCIHEHGLPTDPREWSLEDRRKEKGQGVGNGPELVRCEQCGTIRSARLKKCVVCQGTQLEVFRMARETEGNLVEYRSVYRCTSCNGDRVKLERASPLRMKVTCRGCKHVSFQVDHSAAMQSTEAIRRQEYNRLRLVQIRKNYKPGWVAQQYREVFGDWPPSAWRTEVPSAEESTDAR